MLSFGRAQSAGRRRRRCRLPWFCAGRFIKIFNRCCSRIFYKISWTLVLTSVVRSADAGAFEAVFVSSQITSTKKSAKSAPVSTSIVAGIPPRLISQWLLKYLAIRSLAISRISLRLVGYSDKICAQALIKAGLVGEPMLVPSIIIRSLG